MTLTWSILSLTESTFVPGIWFPRLRLGECDKTNSHCSLQEIPLLSYLPDSCKVRSGPGVSGKIGIIAYARMRFHFKNWSWFYPGHFTFCRLGWAHSRLCWVSLHSTQPTFCRCFCQMRNPTTANFGTVPQKFLFRSNWPLF